MDLQRLRGFLHLSRPRTLLHRRLRGILYHLKVEQESDVGVYVQTFA